MTIFDHDDTYDFEASLGTWEADPLRFPDGIRPLRDLAHERGMKFGIWVEPERVNRQAIGTHGLKSRGSPNTTATTSWRRRDRSVWPARPGARGCSSGSSRSSTTCSPTT